MFVYRALRFFIWHFAASMCPCRKTAVSVGLFHLFEDLGGHCVAAVENNAELPASLHLLKKGSGVSGVQRKLANLQPDVVPGGGHDQFL